jgi:predicted Zn-dependent protease
MNPFNTPTLKVVAAAVLLTACASSSDLPPPRWSRVEDATVSERRFTPEAEYYLGRAGAAQMTERYGVDTSDAARCYVSLLGTYIAYANDLPVPYKGYTFVVLATDEVRAFSAPGGFVLVSRGLLKNARNEDEVAGVVAHELAHLKNRDAIRSVARSKSSSMLTALGTMVASIVGLDSLAGALLQSFEGAVDHAVTNLVVTGFSREQELAADKTSLELLRTAGYASRCYLDFVKRMLAEKSTLLSTHPASEERVAALEGALTWDVYDAPAVERRAARLAAVAAK